MLVFCAEEGAEGVGVTVPLPPPLLDAKLLRQTVGDGERDGCREGLALGTGVRGRGRSRIEL